MSREVVRNRQGNSVTNPYEPKDFPLTRLGADYMNKSRKVEKWKSVKIPRELWQKLKLAAAKHQTKIYEQIEIKHPPLE